MQMKIKKDSALKKHKVNENKKKIEIIKSIEFNYLKIALFTDD